jgi:uncharacterized membrane protein
LKNRIKNYALWVSGASLVLLILQLFGVPVVPEQYDLVVKALLAVLVGLGIVNDPTTENGGFLDDKNA